MPPGASVVFKAPADSAKVPAAAFDIYSARPFHGHATVNVRENLRLTYAGGGSLLETLQGTLAWPSDKPEEEVRHRFTFKQLAPGAGLELVPLPDPSCVIL